MKLLFVCGASIVDGELRCASWIKSILSSIDPEYEVIIVSPNYSGDNSVVASVNQKRVEVISYHCNDSLEYSASLILQSRADVIIIFGTENAYTLSTLEVCKEAGILDHTAVFAQGLCCVCAQHYAEGVPERIIRRYTFRDLLRRQSIKRERESLSNRAINEKKALQITHNFIGRTTMDQAVLRMYNPTANYYQCNDVLRNSFYDGQWSYNACIKHRIFISQYYYPLKGFHYLLEAVSQLKTKYPDIKIVAAGYNPIQKLLPQKELKDSSYIRYIKSLIKQYDLQDNIELLGELSEEQMKEEYLKANVFVMPSTIENSPNSLAEAMMLGVPTVASDVGGVTDFAKHQEEAYIYPSSATYLLAHYIDKVFSEKEGASVVAHNGRIRAQQEYNQKQNIKCFESIMRKLSGHIEE